MNKRFLEILCVVFCVMSVAVSLVQSGKRLNEERKRNLILQDIKAKVDKLWTNLQ